MSKQINTIEIENVIYNLKGIEQILSHLSTSEKFINSDESYMFQLLKNSISDNRRKIENIVYKDNNE